MSDGGQLEAARLVWKSIHARDQTAFSFSDLWHPLRGRFKKSEDIEPAVDILLDHNLILPADGEEKPRRGRRGRKFVINPRARGLGVD